MGLVSSVLETADTVARREAAAMTIPAGTTLGLLPIDKVISKKSFLRCMRTSSTDGVDGVIDGIVHLFDKGASAEGVAGVTKGVVKTLLGGAKGAAQRKQTYAITINSLGGITRRDMFFVALHNCETEKVVTRVRAFVGYMVVSSLVDISSLNRNNMRVVVTECYPDTTPERQRLVEADFYFNTYKLRVEPDIPLGEGELEEKRELLAARKGLYASWDADRLIDLAKSKTALEIVEAEEQREEEEANKQSGRNR
ncbi:hypothetical protein P7C70_g6750, partial [Phenoliferia sp. Uapishka_3]